MWSDLTREFGSSLIQLSTAAVLGGVVGFERQVHGQWTGLRTHMAVAMGAAVFAVAGAAASAESNPSETTRVIQGIATGIGFLGAGAILKLGDRREVKGLTTASSIWLAAAVGATAGLSMYGLALATTLVSLAILALLRPFEKRFVQNFEDSDDDLANDDLVDDDE
jgi:putative Mg2+ transporter-C (MgtC) family protein